MQDRGIQSMFILWVKYIGVGDDMLSRLRFPRFPAMCLWQWAIPSYLSIMSSDMKSKKVVWGIEATHLIPLYSSYRKDVHSNNIFIHEFFLKLSHVLNTPLKSFLNSFSSPHISSKSFSTIPFMMNPSSKYEPRNGEELRRQRWKFWRSRRESIRASGAWVL